MVTAYGGREVCYRCHKPRTQCVCLGLARVQNQVGISVLQHPRERHHPLGTARLLRLGLKNVDLQVCYELLAPQGLRAQLSQPDVGILYPHPRAHALSEHTGPAPRQLIVLDGTWSQARVLYRNNPWMHALPHFCITPDGVDRYRIRREPAAHCASTLEAVVFALQSLEPQTPGLDGLLAHFTDMINRQMACIGTTPSAQRFRRRPKPQRPLLPPLFTETYGRQVVVYCEFRLRRDTHPHVRELSFLAAHHLASAKTMAWAAREAEDNPHHLAHMDLTGDDLAMCRDLRDFAKDWQAFCPPNPVILAWNQASLSLGRQVIGNQVPALLLKALYCNLEHAASGHLEDVVARLQLHPVDVPCPGRPKKRLGSAIAVAAWLRKLGGKTRALRANFEAPQELCEAGQVEAFDAQASRPHQNRAAGACIAQR